MVALIPARSGSKRIPRKNTKVLGANPLIFYTLWAAQQSGVFDYVMVSTDDTETGMFAEASGAAWLQRPDALASDDAPDIGWVQHALAQNTNWRSFAILRPTSPFRTAATIRRAYERFKSQEVHSMRAVEKVYQHPGKMWQWGGAGHTIKPLIGKGWPTHEGPPVVHGSTPWHSQPTQSLPAVFVQNASLEMAWSWVIPAFGTISGNKVAPFFTEGYEGFDLNTMDDWREAERLIKEGFVDLPSLPLATL